MIDAATLRARFPALTLVEHGAHELVLSNPARPSARVTITLPHADVRAEATAAWASAKQIIRVQPNGTARVEESSPFHDEPEAWTASFDAWLDSWLAVLADGRERPRPAR